MEFPFSYTLATYFYVCTLSVQNQGCEVTTYKSFQFQTLLPINPKDKPNHCQLLIRFWPIQRDGSYIAMLTLLDKCQLFRSVCLSGTSFITCPKILTFLILMFFSPPHMFKYSIILCSYFLLIQILHIPDFRLFGLVAICCHGGEMAGGQVQSCHRGEKNPTHQGHTRRKIQHKMRKKVANGEQAPQVAPLAASICCMTEVSYSLFCIIDHFYLL